MNWDRGFTKEFRERYRVATPGLKVQAFHKGRKMLDVALGETHEIYDWASVTKIVFTNTALMFRHDERILKVTDPVAKWVDWWPQQSNWQIRDLQSHSAGLTWWYPFYKQMVKKVSERATPEEAWGIFQGILKRRVLLDFKKQGPSSLKRKPLKSVYSDLDYFMLGVINESLAQDRLYSVWGEVRDRLKLENTDFHRGNRPPRGHRDSAPTEDCAWRGKILKAEVHDQNTWALKGVAPHAGLFGPIEDLSRYGLLLRSALKGGQPRGFPSESTVRLFTRRAIPRTRGDWALGFMMPAKQGASCGAHFSLESIGHTGFTGTSLWFDPKQDLLVSILSNRVHPTVDNIEIRKLRPIIHDWLSQQLSSR